MDKHTKIVATIGPASCKPDMLGLLRRAGMNDARINLSHGDHPSQAEYIRNIRIPDKDFPILTRELIYTALTRARKSITIWGTRSIISKAITRQIKRTSGLRDALWGI